MQEVLNEFLAEYKDLPAQRSEQWLLDRKYTIGGSEISTVANKNPFSSIRDLVELHIGLKKFNGNINTHWGTVLEDFAIYIFEKKWDCTIYETGSLHGPIAFQKYSPDGLTYIKSLDMIILLEIKNATRRIANGKIPSMYKPQILTGLNTIKIANMGMFVDATFRLCSFANFTFTAKYDTEIHPNKYIGIPIALCMCCIYATEPLTTEPPAEPLTTEPPAEPLPAEYVESVLKAVVDGKLHVFNPGFIVEGQKNDLMNRFVNRFADAKYKLVVALPLKLFKFETIPVVREKGYIQKYENVIAETIGNIRQLSELPIDEQTTMLDVMYPRSESS